MDFKNLLILFVLFLFGNSVFSQRKLPANSYNRVGVQGGITYSKISSADLDFNYGTGYTGGFSTRATAGDHFLFIYGINFFKAKTSMEVREVITLEPRNINFNLSGAQINFLLGYRILGEHLGVELGPILQLSGKLTPDEGSENYWLRDYDMNVEVLENITKANMSLAAQISGGFPKLKLWVQYQYGISNMFGDIDLQAIPEKNSAAEDPRGTMRMATAGIVFYL